VYNALMPKFIDLSGKRFGRLAVVSRADDDEKNKQPRWNCVCDCGANRVVYGNALRAGVTTSCGCAHREAITKHGKTKTPEFTVWQMMLQRCTNPNHTSYPSYGGRGITVCARWLNSFADFFADMGQRPTPHHTLDRKNNDVGYSRENCRWATTAEQARNKRNNRMLTLAGRSRTLADWSRHLNIPKNTILNRLARGKSIELALTPAAR
jgi:hypothetical protein